jgi:hypothetical protein
VLLAHDVRIGAIWTLTVGGAWSVGWLTTTSAGIDVERGYVTFGASGALCATLLTGLVMWHALRCRPAPGSSDLHEATPPQPEVTLTHT